MNLAKIKHIHFVGIKGVGMTSLALCAQDLGIKVTGSDIEEVFVTDPVLKKRKINWLKGFSPKNIKDSPDLVITTGAHGGLRNPEVLAAKKAGIRVITHAEGLGLFTKGKETVAVCGVGGKTTISSMVATILEYAKIKPSYAIGVGEIFPIGDPGKYDKKGKHFVCEADEFVNSPGVDNTPKFLFLDPQVIVATNIEYDHPDVYPTFEDTKKAYLKFFMKVSKGGSLIVNADNENTLNTAKEANKEFITYGFNKESDWKIKVIKKEGFKVWFNLINKEEEVKLVISVPGDYNASNAAAAYVVARSLGLEKGLAKKGIESFQGTKRRFEKVGRLKNGAIVIDDYAHHPNEIELVLKAARDVYPKKRLISIFQPHTYSRTRALFGEFAEAFDLADTACFTDIYSSAREKKDPSVSSKKLAKAVGKKGIYLGDLEGTVKWIEKNSKPDDLILTLGAGDIFYIHEDLK